MWLCRFLARIFKKQNKITPFIPCLNKLYKSYNNLELCVKEYRQFINITLPNDTITKFILNRHTFNIRSEFISRFDGLYDEILCKIYNLDPNTSKYHMKKINKYHTTFYDIDIEFKSNLYFMNELKLLTVEGSLLYTNSFKQIFKGIKLPATVNSNFDTIDTIDTDNINSDNNYLK